MAQIKRNRKFVQAPVKPFKNKFGDTFKINSKNDENAVNLSRMRAGLSGDVTEQEIAEARRTGIPIDYARKNLIATTPATPTTPRPTQEETKQQPITPPANMVNAQIQADSYFIDESGIKRPVFNKGDTVLTTPEMLEGFGLTTTPTEVQQAEFNQEALALGGLASLGLGRPVGAGLEAVNVAKTGANVPQVTYGGSRALGTNPRALGTNPRAVAAAKEAAAAAKQAATVAAKTKSAINFGSVTKNFTSLRRIAMLGGTGFILNKIVGSASSILETMKSEQKDILSNYEAGLYDEVEALERLNEAESRIYEAESKIKLFSKIDIGGILGTLDNLEKFESYRREGSPQIRYLLNQAILNKQLQNKQMQQAQQLQQNALNFINGG